MKVADKFVVLRAKLGGLNALTITVRSLHKEPLMRANLSRGAHLPPSSKIHSNYSPLSSLNWIASICHQINYKETFSCKNIIKKKKNFLVASSKVKVWADNVKTLF